MRPVGATVQDAARAIQAAVLTVAARPHISLAVVNEFCRMLHIAALQDDGYKVPWVIVHAIIVGQQDFVQHELSEP